MQDTEAQITLETAQNLGLSEAEFQQIIIIMGRVPDFTELSIFSVMWSEYCSNKNSIYWLKTVPRAGSRLLASSEEEDAKLVDIGDGWACAFNLQSHTPSYIEPYQGGMRGADSIHRGIFTMGARPIVALNSLYFGNIKNAHTRHLLRSVVKGISDHGKAIGVPPVGVTLYFNDSYNNNILVNTMSVGLVRISETIPARADGPGNPVFIVGAATGNVGIHGATSTSSGLADKPAGGLPAVQVRAPFQGKLLLEATLEALQTGAIAGVQDLGAGGIARSTAEMSARSGTGMRINLDKVPTRQDAMKPLEILLSESQDRLLVVAREGQEGVLLELFEKWGLTCAQIGEVTATDRLEFSHQGKLIADLEAKLLVKGGGAPVYQRDYQKPAYLKQISRYKLSHVPKPDDYLKAARQLFSSPNIGSKHWIYQQYDSMVDTNPISSATLSDAVLVGVEGTRKALVLTAGCNSSYVFADPYIGTMIAVAEAARNIVCSGGEPVAITTSLNFGSPDDPEVYWQFVMAIKGMGEACRRFNIPVADSNLCFHHQTDDQGQTDPIYPTPIIGMLGILEDCSQPMTLDFKMPGHQIYMIGTPQDDLGSSEFLRQVHGIHHSPAPAFDLDEEFHVQANLKKLLRKGWIASAHDISGGGLFTALMECAMPRGLGFEIEADSNFRKDAYLFGESQSRILISLALENEDALVNHLNTHNVSFTKLGEVKGERAVIDEEDFGKITEWASIYLQELEQKIEA